MINWVQRHFASTKPVVIDGFLYVVIAVCGAMATMLTSDEVYKYMNVYWIFYIKHVNGVALAAATALKMFRSTSYSKHQEQKKKDAIVAGGGTEFYAKETTTTQQSVTTENPPKT